MIEYNFFPPFLFFLIEKMTLPKYKLNAYLTGNTIPPRSLNSILNGYTVTGGDEITDEEKEQRNSRPDVQPVEQPPPSKDDVEKRMQSLVSRLVEEELPPLSKEEQDSENARFAVSDVLYDTDGLMVDQRDEYNDRNERESAMVPEDEEYEEELDREQPSTEVFSTYDSRSEKEQNEEMAEAEADRVAKNVHMQSLASREEEELYQAALLKIQEENDLKTRNKEDRDRRANAFDRLKQRYNKEMDELEADQTLDEKQKEMKAIALSEKFDETEAKIYDGKRMEEWEDEDDARLKSRLKKIQLSEREKAIMEKYKKLAQDLQADHNTRIQERKKAVMLKSDLVGPPRPRERKGKKIVLKRRKRRYETPWEEYYFRYPKIAELFLPEEGEALDPEVLELIGDDFVADDPRLQQGFINFQDFMSVYNNPDLQETLKSKAPEDYEAFLETKKEFERILKHKHK